MVAVTASSDTSDPDNPLPAIEVTLDPTKKDDDDQIAELRNLQLDWQDDSDFENLPNGVQFECNTLPHAHRT
jgi:hypothetical protein